MILDFEQLKSFMLPPVVIVGSGPAALALADSLDRRGISALLLEAGSDEYTHEAQDILAGQTVGDPYFDLQTARLMQFGGSGNHWGGRSRGLDAHDFLPRDDIPHYGWPITKADLDPYSDAVETLLGIDRLDEIDISPELYEIRFGFSVLLNFGEEFRPAFVRSETMHVALRSRVTHLEAAPGRRTRIVVRHSTGDDLISLEPQIAVLATGGIENSRILLWSNEIAAEPVVEEPNALGRYWMEHTHATPGVARAEGYPRNYSYPEPHADRTFLAPKAEVLRRHGVLNGTMVLRGTPFDDDEGALERGLKELSCSLGEAHEPISEVVGWPASCTRGVVVGAELAPVPENRVALSDTERDAHGVPRTVLHFRRTDLDRRTIKVLFELAGRYIVSNGFGIARAHPWTIKEVDHPERNPGFGYHHMGGTRMGTDPRTSVVDANLRVHGMSNLYVAGSSVFPTGGHANPTYPILQLSLRLADHIADIL